MGDDRSELPLMAVVNFPSISSTPNWTSLNPDRIAYIPFNSLVLYKIKLLLVSECAELYVFDIFFCFIEMPFINILFLIFYYK